MHLPDGFLSGPVLAASAVAAGGGVAAVAPAVLRRVKTQGGALLAGSAAVFAAQAANFPAAPGVSAHLLGGALIGATLGAAPAVAVVLPVIVVQAALGDGGLLALGANVLNMAVAAPLVAAAIARDGSPARKALGAVVGVAAAVLLCAVQLVLSGRGPAGALCEGLVRNHVVVAAAEGVLAFAWAHALRREGGLVRRPAWGALATAAVFAALAFAAAPPPDGLEAVAADLGFADAAR